MTNLAYDMITYYADDMRCWQEQFDGCCLSHLCDMAYNYLDMEEDETERQRLAERVAEEIFCMISPEDEPRAEIWAEHDDI